jgi:hypothetical protein
VYLGMVQEHSERSAGTVKCNTQPSTPLNFQGPPLSHDRLKNSKPSLTFLFSLDRYTLHSWGYFVYNSIQKKQSINIQVIPTMTYIYISISLFSQNGCLNCNTVHKKQESLLMHKGWCHSLLYRHNNSVIHFIFHLTETGMDSTLKLKLN